ncbi:MAG TPA: DUF5615 family PIN-like protein [Pseudonocardiaceae bacterium]|nr:DUF5615 family PIN-like protein [Pseudonocardiaceae bacterium]
MTARVLLDEVLSPAIAEQLRQRGHDVTCVADDLELVGRPDEEILAMATADNRLLVTCNIKDLVPIAQSWRAAGRSHGGLVCVPVSSFPQQRGFVGTMVKALDELLGSEQPPGTDSICFLRRS